jgi:outer membrane lipoprotein-sorting protein
VKSGEATFVEKRQVAQLDQTLESSGRLSFSAPDTFVRETLKPRRERLAVVGNQLTMSQNSRSRSTTLDSVPEAAVIVEAIRGTLTGNRETLERYFTTQLSGAAERWQLDLVPREARLRGQVAQLRVSGRQGQLQEVQMTMADGDRSVMQITPVAESRPDGERP